MRIDPSMLYQQFQTEAKGSKADDMHVGSKALSSYKQGDVIKGAIVDANQSNVIIRLESGQTMEARLTSANTFSMGDSVSFIVKESGREQLLITAMPTDDGLQTNQLLSILGEAGIPRTEGNVELLKAMIDRQLPVDRASLKQMVRMAAKYPDASPRELTFLSKHQIPVNEGTIKQLSMLEGNQHPLIKSMASLVDDLTHAIKSQSAQGGHEVSQLTPLSGDGSEQLSYLLEKVVGDSDTMTFLKDIQRLAEDQPKKQTFQQGAAGEQQSLTESQSGPNASEVSGLKLGEMMMAKDLQFFEQRLAQLIHQDSQAEERQGLPMMKEGLSLQNVSLSMLVQLSKEGFIQPEQLRSFLQEVKSAATYQALAKGLLLSDMKIVEDGEVNRWFNDVQEKVVFMLNMASEIEDTAALTKGAAAVKSSLGFLNSIQQHYNFMHLPLFLNDQLIHSELYVMNHSTPGRSEEHSITALIRLDLLNLGHTDIYVKKTSRNVDVQFYMKNEEQIDVMRENVHQLHKLLINRGFNVLSATVQPLVENFNVLDDFLEQGGQKTDSSRYSFDMKA